MMRYGEKSTRTTAFRCRAANKHLNESYKARLYSELPTLYFGPDGFVGISVRSLWVDQILTRPNPAYFDSRQSQVLDRYGILISLGKRSIKRKTTGCCVLTTIFFAFSCAVLWLRADSHPRDQTVLVTPFQLGHIPISSHPLLRYSRLYPYHSRVLRTKTRTWGSKLLTLCFCYDTFLTLQTYQQ